MAALDEYMDQGEVGALNPSVWQTNPTMAFMAAMRGRGLFGALAAKEQAALQNQQAQQMNSVLQKLPPNLSSGDRLRMHGELLLRMGRPEGKQYIEAGNAADENYG